MSMKTSRSLVGDASRLWTSTPERGGGAAVPVSWSWANRGVTEAWESGLESDDIGAPRGLISSGLLRCWASDWLTWSVRGAGRLRLTFALSGRTGGTGPRPAASSRLGWA